MMDEQIKYVNCDSDPQNNQFQHGVVRWLGIITIAKVTISSNKTHHTVKYGAV